MDVCYMVYRKLLNSFLISHVRSRNRQIVILKIKSYAIAAVALPLLTLVRHNLDITLIDCIAFALSTHKHIVILLYLRRITNMCFCTYS